MADPSTKTAPHITETESTPITNGAPTVNDVEMADSKPAQEPIVPPTTQTAIPTPAPQPASQPVPQPVPIPQPAPASSRNSPHPSAPTHSVPHGSPTRVYLNQRVTPHLLEAMKHLATAEPEKPLKWLSEFLAMKSEEIEG